MKSRSVLLSALLIVIMLFGAVGFAAAQDGGDEEDSAAPTVPSFEDRLAAALGISVEDLQAYWAEGLTLPEIATELGVDLNEVFLGRRGFACCGNMPGGRDGMPGGRGDMPGGRGNAFRGEGPFGNGFEVLYRLDPEAAVQSLADVLGIDAADLQAYIDEGLNLREIAAELELDLTSIAFPDFRAMAAEARNQTIADALGISVEDLQAYWDEGLNLREIAAELEIDLSELDLPIFDRDFRNGPRGRGFDAPPFTDDSSTETDPTAPSESATEAPSA